MAKPISPTTLGRFFPQFKTGGKDPPEVMERTFSWISFIAYHLVCLFQKPSPNHFETGTPSRLQIPPKTSASGCFCYGSPKSLKSHFNYIRTDPTLRSVRCCMIFPEAELNMWLKFSFLPNHSTFYKPLLRKKKKGKITAKDHLTGPYPYSLPCLFLCQNSKEQEQGLSQSTKKPNTGGKAIQIKSTNVPCLCATQLYTSLHAAHVPCPSSDNREIN